MGDKSAIEWTDATWSPTVGCSVVSPGCTNCYAMKLAARLERMGSEKYVGLTHGSKAGPVWNGLVWLDEGALMLPLRWKKPRRIFVNSMSDLFHEDLPDEAIDRVFAVMQRASRHTFQILTKRADRMCDYVTALYAEADDNNRRWFDRGFVWPLGAATEMARERVVPFPNVWLGVSVEDQARADERRQSLADVAAQRWLTWASYEPALGPINWTGWEFLRWIVSGGESGPQARPSHPDWHRVTRDWCAQNGSAYLFKQWGAYRPGGIDLTDGIALFDDGSQRAASWLFAANDQERKGVEAMRRVGKKRAGRLLDGREHNEFPEAPHA